MPQHATGLVAWPHIGLGRSARRSLLEAVPDAGCWKGFLSQVAGSGP